MYFYGFHQFLKGSQTILKIGQILSKKQSFSAFFCVCYFKAVGGGREVKNWSFSVSTYVIEDSIGNPNFFTESKKNARKKSYRHKRLKKSSKN